VRLHNPAVSEENYRYTLKNSGHYSFKVYE
jgi:hypothetical protein